MSAKIDKFDLQFKTSWFRKIESGVKNQLVEPNQLPFEKGLKRGPKYDSMWNLKTIFHTYCADIFLQLKKRTVMFLEPVAGNAGTSN